MLKSYIKNMLARFRDDTRGTILVETVITLPVLVWVLAATYEFFEVHRYQSIRDKATYTVADMISRESEAPGYVDDTYITNSFRLFNDMVNDRGVNQIRISDVTYSGTNDEYEIFWSRVRGTGTMSALTNSDVATLHARLPIMNDGEHFILVESTSNYRPSFTVGMGNNITISTRTFTNFRVLPKICWQATCS